MRSLELFSGAGGLALALEKAGFQSVALLEKDREACRTLRWNRPDWNVIESDVRVVDFRQFGPIDLIAGGPPCQPFSMGGKAKGHTDARDMFPEAVRAVRELAPSAFMFENVRGLMRPAFTDYVEFIRLQLTYPDFPISANTGWEGNLRRLQRHHTSAKRRGELTYQVVTHLADAADFGVSQRRHRVFFVGVRSDLAINWSFPVRSHSHEDLLNAQYVSGVYWREHGVNPPRVPERLRSRVARLQSDLLIPTTSRWRTVRDAIHDLPDPRAEHNIPNHRFQPGAKSYPGHTGSPLDEPSKALKAGDHGVPGGENMLRHANGKVRYFTIREASRIQTFPDEWVFPGTWSESMRQLGNAVPVDLGAAVARSLYNKLKTFHRSSRGRASEADA